MTKSDGKVVISTKLDNTGFTNGISGLKSSLKNLAGALGVAFGVSTLVNFSKISVKAASDMRSAFTGLQSIVEGQGRSFKEAKAFIQEYISDGLVPATNAVTAYKNLAMRGYDDKQIQEVMIALKNSSAYGRSAALTMGESVSSATEGLKNENSILVDNAGVTKNVSMMWKDYARSIGVGVDSLTQQQKIQAEVNGILHETRFQTGDASKVAGDYAGQVLGLKFACNDFRVALGNMIMPISQTVIPAIKAMINAVTRLMSIMGQITGALFGTTAKQQQNVEDTAIGAASAENDLAQATKNAAKAAKSGSASIDELNVIQKDTASGASDVGMSGGVSANHSDETPDTEELPANIATMVGKIKDLLLPLQQISFDNLSVALGKLKEAITPLSKSLFEGLEWAYRNVFVPYAKWTVEKAVPAFVKTLAAYLDGFNKVLDVFKPIGIWLWDNFLQPLASWTGGAVIEVLQKLRDIYEQSAQWFSENKEKLLGLFEAVSPLLKSIGDSLLRTFDRIKDLFLKVYQAVIDIFIGILDFIVGVFTGDWKQAWEGLKAVFFGVISALESILLYFWEMLVDGFNTGLENIKIIWEIVAEWFDTNVIQPIADFFSGMWTVISTLAVAAYNGVIGIWQKVSKWFDDKVIKPLTNAFESMWEGIKRIFGEVWDAMSKSFKGYINGWLDLIEGFANFFINMLNKIIDALNTIQIDIPEWVPEFGGSTFGINIDAIPPLKLPRLATGAVIPANREFMAILGDQKHGTNIEAPADLIRQIVREETAGLAQQSSQPIEVELILDGDVLYRKMVDVKNRQGYRIGGVFANAY